MLPARLPRQRARSMRPLRCRASPFRSHPKSRSAKTRSCPLPTPPSRSRSASRCKRRWFAPAPRLQRPAWAAMAASRSIRPASAMPSRSASAASNRNTTMCTASMYPAGRATSTGRRCASRAPTSPTSRQPRATTTPTPCSDATGMLLTRPAFRAVPITSSTGARRRKPRRTGSSATFQRTRAPCPPSSMSNGTPIPGPASIARPVRWC